jgi:hypothetical protein
VGPTGATGPTGASGPLITTKNQVAYFGPLGTSTSDPSFTYDGTTLTVNGNAYTQINSLKTATTNAVVVSSGTNQFDGSTNITTVPYPIASIPLANFQSYDSLLLLGNFSSAFWGGPNVNTYNADKERLFYLGYGIDNATPIFDSALCWNFYYTDDYNTQKAQGCTTISRVLRKGIDYSPGAQLLLLFVAGNPNNTGTNNNLCTWDYTMALIPVV